jgi:hypothetical protein
MLWIHLNKSVRIAAQRKSNRNANTKSARTSFYFGDRKYFGLPAFPVDSACRRGAIRDSVTAISSAGHPPFFNAAEFMQFASFVSV